MMTWRTELGGQDDQDGQEEGGQYQKMYLDCRFGTVDSFMGWWLSEGWQPWLFFLMHTTYNTTNTQTIHP